MVGAMLSLESYWYELPLQRLSSRRISPVKGLKRFFSRHRVDGKLFKEQGIKWHKNRKNLKTRPILNRSSISAHAFNENYSSANRGSASNSEALANRTHLSLRKVRLRAWKHLLGDTR